MKLTKIVSLLLSMVMILGMFALQINAGAIETVTVTVAVQKDGAFLVAPQSVTVTDGLAEEYGYTVLTQNHNSEDVDAPTVFDAMVAIHKAKYGDAFTTATAKNYLDITSGFVTKAFGEPASSSGFFVNSATPADDAGTGYSIDTAELKNGDVFEYWFYQDTTSWSDSYTCFDVKEKTVYAGDTFDLTMSMVAYDQNWVPSLVPIDGSDTDNNYITINTVNADGTISESIKDASGNDVNPDANGKVTLSFENAGTYVVTAKGSVNKNAPIVSPICIVTVEESSKVPKSSIELGITASNGSIDYVTFFDEAGNELKGVSGSLDQKTITVKLPKDYSPSGKVKAVFSLTQNSDGIPFVSPKNGVSGTSSGKAWDQRTNTYTTTLSSGSGKATVYFYDVKPTNWRNNTYDTYTINYEIANELPALADGVDGTANASTAAGIEYKLDLSTIFADADGDALTYTVKVNGAEAVAADANYSIAPTIGGTYTLEFFANDGKKTSEESYTVTLTVSNSDVSYNMTVLLPSDILPVFYITNGYDANGVDILGDTLVSAAGVAVEGNIPHTVSVPENISEISVRDSTYGGMAIPAASASTVTLCKVQTGIIDLGEKAVAGTVSVAYDSHKASDIDGNFLLIEDKEYTFSASPSDSATYSSATTTETVVAGTEAYAVNVKVSYKNPKTVITTTGAKAKLFKYSSNYFVHTVYEPLATVDNGDGTSTHYFSASGDLSYRVSMDGKITKAGYLSGNSVNAVYTDDDKLPSERVDYLTAGTNAAIVADDSVLLNINQQNHLSLSVEQTKTVKAYRAWQIINNYMNHIIEPDFHFTVLAGEDVVSLAPYENQPMTNSGGNWRILTALKEGTAVIEVTYDAISITGGSYSGVYGATDTARSGLFVVTVGENTPDVDFGIKCKTGAGSVVYTESNSKPWDAEFDTLYFFGESGKIELSPAVSDGSIIEVAVSADKGASYTALEATYGVYTAPIISGNNIIRVTTDSGVAYQIVRGDKIELVVKNVTNPDKPIAAGDTINLKLVGVHTPVPKISGTFNPGYAGNTDGASGVHLRYSFGDETVVSTGKQYDFSLNGTTMEFTVPADGEATDFTLTDGYISVGVIGVAGFSDDGDSHRNIPDSGGGTRGTTTTFTSRSLLPDITVSVGMLPSGNTAPFIRESAPKTATLNLGGTYALSMSKVFTDRDGDVMTYTAKVGEGEAVASDAYYTFTPDAVGTYTITFTANDGKTESDVHTVTITVKEKESGSSASTLEFDIDDEEIDGYVRISFVDTGKRVEGEDNVTYPVALGTIISTKRVPFTEGDTVADVTIRLLDALEFTYEYTGTTKEGFYLSSIGDFTLKGIDYDSFGEFDAGSGSGWMITLNKDFIEYGASEFEVENGDVVKWQYTCQLGADIGDPFYSGNNLTSTTKKDEENTEEDSKKFTYTKDTYNDVSTDAWYYEAAKYTYEYGLMQGADGRFDADGQMTRAMLVTVLYRLDGENKVESKSSFTDVPENEWYADAVAWAAANHIVIGVSETEFAPDVNITREQVASVMYRYAKFKGYDIQNKANLNGYEDADEISEYAENAFAWAVAEKLIGGTTEFTVSPRSDATRAHVAIVIMRIRENIK